MKDIEFLYTLKEEEEKPKAVLSAPRRREMNDDPDDDFVAIDFETMTRQKTSACAIGMVRVIDGNIAQRFYTLINPIRDDMTDSEPNFRIHGIPLAEAEKAPDFSEVFKLVKLFIQDLKIVCHSRSIDINIFNALMEYYGLSGIDTSNNVCTYEMTGLSLEKCCEEIGIKLPAHHDALCDAEACAKIYLYGIGKPIISQSVGSLKEIHDKMGVKKIDKENRIRLSDEDIQDKTTIFYDATVVITGTFDAFPERNDIAKSIQKLGAKITSSISSRTTHVIIGDGAGPKKIEKINDLKSQGYDIRVIYEPELIKILNIH